VFLSWSACTHCLAVMQSWQRREAGAPAARIRQPPRVPRRRRQVAAVLCLRHGEARQAAGQEAVHPMKLHCATTVKRQQKRKRQENTKPNSAHPSGLDQAAPPRRANPGHVTPDSVQRRQNEGPAAGCHLVKANQSAIDVGPHCCSPCSTVRPDWLADRGLSALQTG
jgi:hypothetical protein